MLTNAFNYSASQTPCKCYGAVQIFTQARLRLRNSCRPSEATHVVCAERRCTADRQSVSSGPHLAITAQP